MEVSPKIVALFGGWMVPRCARMVTMHKTHLDGRSEGVEKLCHGANRNLADPSGAFFRAKSLPLTGILAQLWLFRAIFSLLFCPFSTSRRITPWD
jgi:hypothetical protein